MEENKKGRGRPKKQDNSYLDKIFEDEDDDLRNILKAKPKSDTPEDADKVSIDNDTLNDIEEFEKQEGVNDIPDNEFNPLEEPVMQRSYTGGITNSGGSPINPYTLQEKIIEEPKYNATASSSKIDVDNDLINPNSNTDSKGSGNTAKNINDIPNDIPNTSNDVKREEITPQSENIKELSPKEKREAVEKTADAILIAWRSYVPLPFIYFSKFNEKKLKKLHDNDEIDLDIEVKSDGTNFREYVKEFNSNVEQIFSVSDEEVLALKDPLVDVLMEKDIALTPTQRLLFTAGQLLVSKVMMCAKLISEKKSDMEDMKIMHSERIQLRERELEEQKQSRLAELTKQQRERAERLAEQERNRAEILGEQKSERAERLREERENERENERKIREEQKNTFQDVEDDNIIEIVKDASDKLDVDLPTLDDALNSTEIDDDYDIPSI